MTNNLTPVRHKYVALDALRGIAALMVIFQHFWEMNHPSDARFKPWLFFCAGHEAVILFFVLSGFVLMHQLRDYQLSDYGKFIGRRILRIYPAYYVALILSGTLLLIIRDYFPSALSGNNLTDWFYIWSRTNFDTPLWLGSISLISHEGSSLNVAVWSLFYEMWISLLFPFFIYTLGRGGWLLRIVIVACLGFISIKLWQTGQFLNDPWQGIVYYLWYFLLGALLYTIHHRLRFLAQWWVLVIGCGLYFSNYLTYGMITNRLLHEVIIAGGCFIILLNGIYNKVLQAFLHNTILQFYGKISYSLYLFHLPVLYGLSYCLLRDGDNLVLVKALTIMLATLVSWISYRYVEMGGIKYGKQLFGKAS